jgi:hypothetical protein
MAKLQGGWHRAGGDTGVTGEKTFGRVVGPACYLALDRQAIFFVRTFTNNDLGLLKVNVFDPQAQAFHQA